jgi:hypothetical protein
MMATAWCVTMWWCERPPNDIAQLRT